MQKNLLPDLLEYFHEEIILPQSEYCIENLADLTVELACNKWFTKIIPNANAQNESDANEDDESGSLLQDYLDCPPLISTTCWCWLQCLGFSYDI